VLCCGWCSGQLHNSFSVRGEVQHDPGQRVDDLYVELYEQDRHMLVEKVAVSFDGQFEIRQASAGNYEIRLVDRLGNAIRSEYTRLNGDGQPLTFRFTRERPKVPGGPVSLSALRHGENRKAMREFHLAAKATAKGDIASSVTHLNKSIVLDPDYAPAHNQLGLIFATLGDQENSLLEFKKTVALDSSLVIPHGNLAIALFRTDRLGEAEAEARKAIQLDSNYAKGHYVLALCLLRQHKYGKETLAQLRQASEAFPQARVLVEKLEAAVGREVVPELSAPRPLR
jgi:tetratricopeptide (TPR) repeat protein